MMFSLLLLILHVFFALGVGYTTFCRIHLASRLVHWHVRWSWALMGTFAVAIAVAPLLGWISPTPVGTAFIGACFCTFLSTARAWDHGVPAGLSRSP